MASVKMTNSRKLLTTARYLSPHQIWYRGRRILRQKWWKILRLTAPQPTEYTLSSVLPLYKGLEDMSVPDLQLPDITQAVAEARAVASGQFTFLNATEVWNDEPDWHATNVSRLWRYHLHYFDYVRSLLIWAAKCDKDNRASAAFSRLARSWIENNRYLQGDGWHPYTISLRIVNWLHALGGIHHRSENSRQRDSIIRSLYGQARILFSNLEFDVRGNHLLENLRALIWAGIAFNGREAERWLSASLAILRQETEEQILSDGGHFERVPGYHLVVLRNYLEIGLWLRRNGGGSPAWLDLALRHMLDFLIAILPPGGQIPLFKDTTYDHDMTPHALLAAGSLYFAEPRYKRSEEFGVYPFLLYGLDGQKRFQRWAVNHEPGASRALTDSGYYVMRDDSEGDFLILDAGKPCPDYLPAHAHADLLSYELSVDRQRVVVDSGVYEYESGEWRSFFRSTRAHNTVEIAGEDQSEVWNSFRVARRATPQVLHWKKASPWCIVQAEHDGYSRLQTPVQHRRTLIGGGGYWLVLDELTGDMTAEISSYVHFHPSLKPRRVERQLWRIEGASVPLWLTSFEDRDTVLVEGEREPRLQAWYSEKFGQRISNPVLVLQPSTALPVRCGYIIARSHPAHICITEKRTQFEATINWGENRHILTIPQYDEPTFS